MSLQEEVTRLAESYTWAELISCVQSMQEESLQEEVTRLAGSYTWSKLDNCVQRTQEKLALERSNIERDEFKRIKKEKLVGCI